MSGTRVPASTTLFRAVAGTMLAVAFAGLALLSGLDRIAANTAGLPALVDWPYARNAPFNAAFTAATRKHWPLAEALAIRAIDADPVNEHLIGGLGQMRLAAGNAKGAAAAFQVSVQRGWRDPSTHLYWMNQSIEASDFATAALHADALLRMNISDELRDQIVNSLLEYDEGRTALATRLRTNPPWSSDFVVKITDLSDDALAAHADVAVRAGGHVFTCSDTAGFINRLINIDAAAQAAQLYKNSCPQSASLIQDRHFTTFAQHRPTSAFNWFTPENSQIPSAPNDPSGVSFTSNNDVTQQILAQRLVLDPGAYRLTWDMLDTPPNVARKLLVDLSCTADIAKARPGNPVGHNTTMLALQFRVVKTCTIPELTFWLRTIDGTIKIDNVRLEKIAGP